MQRAGQVNLGREGPERRDLGDIDLEPANLRIPKDPFKCTDVESWAEEWRKSWILVSPRCDEERTTLVRHLARRLASAPASLRSIVARFRQWIQSR